MIEPSKRIACGCFVAVLMLSVTGIAAQAAYDNLPKPALVKSETRVAYTVPPPKQQASVAAVKALVAKAIVAIPTPTPTPKPTPSPTPTPEPTPAPTPEPTAIPTPEPTPVPTAVPVVVATSVPVQPVVASGSHTDWMAAAGIAASDYGYVDFIVKAESGWRVTVSNPSSGSYGLCQSLPASKMASAGSDYLSNPVTQLKWCNSYAQERYGGWYQSFLAWQRQNWW